MTKMNVVIDLGSKFLGMSITDRNFVWREPAVVAEDKLIQGNYIASGLSALQKDRDDDYSCKIVYPIQNGEIVNKNAFEYLIVNALQKVLEENVFLPRINVFCAVACSTSNDTKRIIDDIFNGIGVKKVEFVLSPIADAAIARMEFGLSGIITLNMGYNLTQISIVDGNEILSGITMQWGAVNLLDKIIEYVRQKYNMAIGRIQANELLVNCVSLHPNNMSSYRLKGVNTLKNIEEVFEVSARELYETMFSFFGKIVSVTNSLVASMSGYSMDKLRTNGVLISGGLCAIEGIEKFLYSVFNMPIHMVSTPENTTIEGLRLVAKNFSNN